MFLINKSHLEEIIPILLYPHEWMILKKLIPIFFVFSGTFQDFKFLIDKSHLEEIILIFFVSDELWYLQDNSNIFCLWWMNDT